jgi:hypothetical protein
MSAAKKSFLREVAEALVIRVPQGTEQPKIKDDSFKADLINTLLLRPVYRRPKDEPKK